MQAKMQAQMDRREQEHEAELNELRQSFKGSLDQTVKSLQGQMKEQQAQFDAIRTELHEFK